MDSGITSRNFPGIEFVQTRIAHNETDFDTIPKAMAAAYGTPAGPNLPLDEQLGELVRLLVAVNNRCAYCTILHASAARKLGIPDTKVDAISAWRQSLHYTDAETVAFAYTEALSNQRHADIQGAHDQLREHFDNAAIEALTMVIINMDVWTRLFLARGHSPQNTD